MTPEQCLKQLDAAKLDGCAACVAAHLAGCSACTEKAAAKKLAKDVGGFVLRLLTACARALASSPAPSACAAAELLAIARCGLDALRTVKPHLKLAADKPLSALKLVLNLIQRLVDAKMFAEAAPYVADILRWLSEYKAQKAAKAAPKAEKGAKPVKPPAVPTPSEADDPAFSSLVSSAMLARCLCLVHTPARELDASTVGRCVHECSDWIQHLGSLDAAVPTAQKHRHNLGRMLGSAAQKLEGGAAAWPPECRLSVSAACFDFRLLSVEVFSTAGSPAHAAELRSAVDSLTKAGTGHEKRLAEWGVAGAKCFPVVDGYERCVELLSASCHGPPFGECLGMMDHAEQLCLYKLGQPERAGSCSTPLVALAKKAATAESLIALGANLCSAAMRQLTADSDMQQTANTLRSAAAAFSDARTVCFKSATRGMPSEYFGAIRTVRCVQRLRKQVLDDTTPAFTGELYLAVEAVFHKFQRVLAVCRKWESRAKGLSKLRFAGMLKIDVELLAAACSAHLLAKADGQPDCSAERAMRHTEAATQLIKRDRASQPEMKLLLSMLYNTGHRLTNVKALADATVVLSSCCQLLQNWAEFVEDHASMMRSRLSLLISACKAMDDMFTAEASLVAIVQWSESFELFTDEQHAAVLEFAVALYVDLQMSCRASAYVSLHAVCSRTRGGDSMSKRPLHALDEEVRLLQRYATCYSVSTSKQLVDIIGAELEASTAISATQRSHLLICKAQTVRASNPLHEGAPLAACVLMASEAVSVLGDSSEPDVLEQRALASSWKALFGWEKATDSRATAKRTELYRREAVLSFADAVACWSKLLAADNEAALARHQATWMQLNMVAGFFKLQGDHGTHIHCLRLRCQLDERLQRAQLQLDHDFGPGADIVACLSELSAVHASIGLDEHAVELLARAQTAADELDAEENGVAEAASFLVAAAEAQCLAVPGRFDDALTCVVIALPTAEAHKRCRSIEVAKAMLHTAAAVSHEAAGNIQLAMDSALVGLRLRVQFVPSAVIDAVRNQVADDHTVHAVDFTDTARAAEADEGGSLPSCDNETALPFSSSAASCSNQWTTIADLIENFRHAARLANILGRGKEASQYLEVACSVAHRISALALSLQIECATVESELHKENDAAAEQRLVLSRSLLPAPAGFKGAVSAVAHKVLEADIQRKDGQDKLALATYGEARSQLLQVYEGIYSTTHVVELDGQQYRFADFHSFDIKEPEQPKADAPKPTSSSDPPGENLSSLTVPKLKARLKKLGLSISGKKADLVQRLTEAACSSDADVPPGADATATTCRNRCGREKVAAIDARRGWCLTQLQQFDAAAAALQQARTHATEPTELATVAYFSACLALAQDGNSAPDVWSLHRPENAVDGFTQRGPLSSQFEEAVELGIKASAHGLVALACSRLVDLYGRHLPSETARLLHLPLSVPLVSQFNDLSSQRERAEPAQECSKDALMTTEAFDLLGGSVTDGGWSVCTLSIVDDQVLHISRLRKDGDAIVMKIPLDFAGTNHYEATLAKWESVMQGNTDTLQSTRGKGDKLTQKEIDAWWNERTALDAEMQTSLAEIEATWLGGFKGLVCGTVRDEALREQLLSRASDIADGCSEPVDADLLELCLSSIDLLTAAELIQACTDLLAGSVRAGPHGGAKALAKQMRSEFDAAVALANLSDDADGDARIERNATLLLLAPCLQELPWESMSCLSAQATSRIFTLQFAAAHMKSRVQACDISNAYYVLNPGQDLQRTQDFLEPLFAEHTGWSGVAGRAPTEEEYSSGLAENDFFVYCGHSTGERYLRGSQLQSLERCATTLLMGCSSGRLSPLGDYGLEGMPLHYQLAGCPSLVANLWDVTDRDIDRLCASLIDSLDAEKATDSTTPLCSARQACRLQFLCGAAPVLFGIPLTVK